jgi:hypothetical protein
MYLIVISTTDKTGGGLHSRAPFTNSQHVTEYLNEQEFKTAASRLLAAGTKFDAYTAQRVSVATTVHITVEE